MKKLMTMMSAVAAAFGLYATSPSDTGTSFEGLAAGSYDIYENGGTAAQGGELSQLVDPGDTYWVTNETSEVPELTIVAETSISQASKRPERYELADQDKYLKIKTTLGNPVTRNANLDGSATAIGDGFYFDSLVRFTAFDSDPTIDLGNDGKLAIWLKEEIGANDIPTATNLVLTAGYIDENLGTKVVQTNYTCTVGSTVNLCDGGWHRVTVKAIDNIYSGSTVRPGFVVFIDGLKVKSGAEKGIAEEDLTPVADSYNTDGALFPSALQTGEAGVLRAIKSVSFDGQGDVDDLVFTATAPAFANVSFYQLKLGANVESVTYVASKSSGAEIEHGTITAASPSKLIEYEERMYVEVTDIQYANGYMGNGVTGVGVDAETGYYKPGAPNLYTEFLAKAAGASVNGVSYETLSDAFDYINDSGTVATSFEVALSANAEGSIELTRDNIEVVLDLKGFSITGGVSAAAITLNPDNDTLALTITNSTVDVGSVVAGQGQSAVSVVWGDLVIGGGIFDGYVEAGNAVTFKITDGKFSIADNETDLGTLNTAVEAGLGSSYELAPELLLPPTYYVITEKQGPTTVQVDFINGELIVATTNIEVGTTLVAPEVSKTGYTLSGWFYGDPAVAWNFSDTVSEAMTLTAGWTINTYTVTFDVAGTTSSITKDYNTTIAAEEVPAPETRIGYTGAWDTDPVGETVTDNVTYTYTYTATEYDITYLNEDGTSFTDWAENFAPRAKYTIEDNVTLPTSTDVDLQVVGVEFGGWTNETGTVTGWSASEKTGNVTVYAKLDPIVAPTPEITPGTGVTSVEVAASDAADAISKVTVVAPTGSGIDTPEEEAAYLALLDITAEPVLGKEGYYEVAINGIKDTVVTAVDADAVAVFSGDTSVTIPQGLYYRITPSTSLPIPASVEAGTVSDGEAITVSKPGTTQGFLRIELSVSPITPANN